MRQSYLCALAVMSFLAVALSLSAQQGPINPKAVALLRWYPANLTTSFSTVTGAMASWAVTFDGRNIWVASYDPSNWGANGTVTKLRASDGAALGTFTVGARPFALAFDGANIWVANWNDGTVTKLRASDGATLGTFSVGLWPTGLAFDGSNIWVANS